MSDKVTNHNQKPQKPLRLPFEKRRRNGDWGSWIYYHRVGLLSTVVVFLSCAIVFLSYKIVVGQTPLSEMISIEFEKDKVPEPPKPEKDKELEKLEKMLMDGGKPQNKISNENSQFNSSLRDSKGTNASEIYDEIERVRRELEDGKANGNQGLGDIGQKKGTTNSQKGSAGKSSSSQSTSDGNKNQRERVKGNVFVSYSLDGRTDTYLYIPAYMCQYGGVVVVNITVNRSGKVIAANIDKSTSSSDDCIQRMAVQSSLASSFDASTSAPDKQKGTITYRFVPQ